jgi:hypothetical protein
MATITRTSDQERERLRRAAMGADQGPDDEQQARVFSRDAALDQLGDPEDPTRVTFPFLRRMRGDHMIAMGDHFIKMPIVSANFYFEADDARAAAFADNLVRPIYGSTMLTLLRIIWAGFSPAAKNFTTVNPAWTYLPGTDQDPKRVWDADSGVDALIYKPLTELRPENALPQFKNGNFNGIRYDARYGGIGYFLVGGDRKPDIDLLHSVWAVHDKEGADGSPFGIPRIAYCAPIFYMYRYIWTLLGRAFENNADPGPVARFPQQDPTTLDSEGNPIKPAEVALRFAKRRRSGSSLALPSDTYTDDLGKPTSIQKWGIEYPKTETSFSEIINFLGFLESAKLRALWLQEQGIIEGSGGQSNRNVASEFGDQRDASQIVLMRQLMGTVVDQMVRPAMAMNMPWYEGKLEMKVVGFSSDEDDVVKQIIQLAGQEDFKSFGADVRRILESRGVPMLSPADYRKVQQQAAEKANNMVAPKVEPTQGRRALVTQTGFDRETGQPVMSYVQLNDYRGFDDLVSDDGFVLSLPRTDAFSDRMVVAASRSLRRASASFLNWAYSDFARYVARQRTLDLEDMLSVIGQEYLDEHHVELDREGKARRAADRIMAGWRPRIDRVDGFSDDLRSVITRVFDRAAGLHLGRLQAGMVGDVTGSVVTNWASERVAAAVADVMTTTRDQLADVLAQGIKDRHTTSEIAADIREHFDGHPAARAAAIARLEVARAYNFATIQAGIKAGVAKCQLIDESSAGRNGRIVGLSEALGDDVLSAGAAASIRLLPDASESLSIRRERLDGFKARFDRTTDTILLDVGISPEEESAYLIALGDQLAASDVAKEAAVA